MKKIITIIGMMILFLQPSMTTHAQEGQNRNKNDLAIEKQVDKIMKKNIGNEIPGASIGIVKNGKVILTKGYGVSNIDKKTPVTADQTVFEMASVTKLFTWSMLMKLAEEGMDLENADQLKPLKETITKEMQPKQVYEPGTVTAYSNYGANLAGYIIEQVTGQSYIKYMNQFVHKQLQMNHSTFSVIYDDQPIIKNNMSLGYVPDGSSFKVANPFLSNDIPSGSLLSTATDMTHFMLALLNDNGNNSYKVFRETKTLKQLETQSYSMVPGATGNAHGFWENKINGKRIIEHSGNGEGFSSNFSLAPKEGLGYVLLTNVAREATGIRQELEAVLYGKDSSTIDLPLKKSPTDKKLAGRYRGARSPVSTMAKLGSIVVDFDTIITENKNGGINIKVPGEKNGVLMVEVKPGIYQKAKKKADDTSQQFLYVETNKKGKVLRIGTGMATDLLPVNSVLDTQLFNFVEFGISFISFLGSLIYLLIKFTKYKRKKITNGWSRNYTLLTAFSAVGLLVMVTAVVMILKFAANLTIIMSSMQLLFYINWLLPIATVAMIIWLAINWRKYDAKKLTIFLILIGLLTSVQFYNVHLFF